MNNTTTNETDSLHGERYELTERLGNLRHDSKVWPPLQSARWFAEEIAMTEGALAHVERCLDAREGR